MLKKPAVYQSIYEVVVATPYQVLRSGTEDIAGPEEGVFRAGQVVWAQRPLPDPGGYRTGRVFAEEIGEVLVNIRHLKLFVPNAALDTKR